MEFTNDSAKIVKTIVSKFDECQPEKFSNKTFKNNLSKLLTILYDDIEEANKYVENRILTGCFNGRISNKIVKPSIYNSNFIPDNVKAYIEKNGFQQMEYSCSIEEHDIRIRIMLFNNEELDKLNEYMKFVYIWLSICYKYSNRICADKLDIYLYLTPFKKFLPINLTDILDTENVNSAVTLRCAGNGEIVIFRNEEWMKVLIHETFHSFGLDMNQYAGNILKKKIKKLFPIDSSFEIAEAYTETWARIINAAFTSYNSMKESNENKSDFILYMTFSLQIERLFALEQIKKILSFMNLDYEILYGDDDSYDYLRKNLYREKTHVFSYYILCGIFMNNFYEFLVWCNKNNLKFLNFRDESQNNVIKFGEFIEESYLDETLLDGLKCHIFKRKKNKFILNTTRMSAIEIP